MHQRTLGTERREIVADATALLQRLRRLLEAIENARNRIRHRSHDKTIEQRHLALAARTGQDAARRQEGEVVHQVAEALFPQRPQRLCFGGSDRPGHPRKTVADGGFTLLPVLEGPDVTGHVTVGHALQHPRNLGAGAGRVQKLF